MFYKLLPPDIRKYLRMSKRQRQHEVRMTLWHVPLLYVVAAIIIAVVTILLDINMNVPAYSDRFVVSFETTRLLVSALVGGILTLSAFTLNSLLVVLTTFSGQFSPRMLQDFISDRQTQHLLGMFNGSFVYVLLMFLFMSTFQNSDFVIVPIVTVLLTFLTAIGFIFFINHATSWMQVHNITDSMKRLSEKIITSSLATDIENLKVSEPGDLKDSFRSQKKAVSAPITGYVQLVDFSALVKKAQEDDIIIELHEKIGSFVLSGNQLFSYWGAGADNVDEEAYKAIFVLGHKETEIQDANSAMSKLAELAVKSIGNNDPRSAINTIYQLAGLMQTVDQRVSFSPYLADSDKQVRVITQPEQFESFLYRGFGLIRHYAPDDIPVITEIINSMRMLAHSTDPVRHQDIWHFTENTVKNISQDIIYDIDNNMLLSSLFELAEVTGNEKKYYALEKKLTGDTP